MVRYKPDIHKSDIVPLALAILGVALVALVVGVLGPYAWLAPVAGGVMLAGYGVHRLRETRSTHRWPRAVGTISSAAIDDYGVAVSKYRFEPYFFPKVEFSYTFEGRRYSGSRMTLDARSIWSPDRDAIERVLEDLAPGTQVPVYVNPRRPEMAVLLPGAPSSRRSHYWALAVGGGLLVAAGYGIHLLEHA